MPAGAQGQALEPCGAGRGGGGRGRREYRVDVGGGIWDGGRRGLYRRLARLALHARRRADGDLTGLAVRGRSCGRRRAGQVLRRYSACARLAGPKKGKPARTQEVVASLCRIAATPVMIQSQHGSDDRLGDQVPPPPRPGRRNLSSSLAMMPACTAASQSTRLLSISPASS